MTDEMSNPLSLSELESYFSDDYSHFDEVLHPPETSDRQVRAIWDLLSLTPGSSVLDLGCGYGRIANRLAKKGARVAGFDISPVLLKKAELGAAQSGVDVEYVLGDMRSLPWRDQFDAAFLWYTTFGFFDDADNERVLCEVASSLRRGGRLLIDSTNPFASLRQEWPIYRLVQRNDDLRVDIWKNDALTGRRHCEKILVRNGSVTRTRFSYRQYGFFEYVRMLRNLGFHAVEAFGEEGGAFTPDGQRLLVLARK
ncbi:class I SAM-dependent methyltransferase [Bradyrhizobium sp. DASA03007]|uniref:class I SAM-dependent methyltransferase n=1 Tax=unclassified Bradyrhizobium TaxID=2631580 RepID=UPI003F729305